MKQVYLFLAEGFEEVEALTPVDILRRAGITCTTVSIGTKKEVAGSHNIVITADKLFDEIDSFDADAIILPGGLGGTNNLKAHKGVQTVIEKFYSEKKLICAICAAPTILGEMGFLKGLHAVCYPGLEEKLLGAHAEKDPFCYDGNILTGRGPAKSMLFALKIVELLLDEEKMNQIKQEIVF